MAMLKSINTMTRAPEAPETIPDTALVLLEIDGQVYKLAWADLVAAVVAEVPAP